MRTGSLDKEYQVAQMVKNPLVVQENQFDPWVRKIPWRREWQPTTVFLPGQLHGQRSLAELVHGVAKSWTQLSN